MNMFRLRRSALRATATAVAGLLLVAYPAAAQYTHQVLLPPAPMPANTTATRGFAMNSSGQVFGEAVQTGPLVVQPVLWTNGVPAVLPLPPGYSWDNSAGRQFINDAGMVVSSIATTTYSIIRWQNGAYLPPLPALPASTLSPLGCSTSYVDTFPMGLNNNGDILVLATQAGCPRILWRFDVTGYQELAATDFGPTTCSPSFLTRFNGPFLNDANHIAINVGPVSYPNPSCQPPQPLSAGILDNGTYTVKIGLSGPPASTGLYGALALNNNDQLLAGDDGGIHFWDGAAIVDLGSAVGVSMNDFGEVLFSTFPAWLARVYRNGSTDDVPFPTQIPGFTLDPAQNSNGGTVAINAGGQLLISMYFEDGGPFGSHTDHIVLFTPTAPDISWPVPADIPYGTPLDATQLNATASDSVTHASVPGTFVYTPPSGTILDVGDGQQLSLTFTPTPLGYARTSATQRINVTKAPTTLTSSPSSSSSVFGQSVEFTATLGATPPNALAATGSIQFSDGASSLGSAPLVPNNGVLSASISTAGLSAGSHSIKADYSGDSHYLASTAQPIPFTVNAATTSTDLTSSPNPSNAGQSVTLTATVSVVSPGQGTPTGLVTFSDGATQLGTSSLGIVGGNAVATLSTSSLSGGTHSLTASYQGTSSFAVSTSSSHSHVVNAVASPSTTSLTASANPIAAGQSLTLTATVAQVSGSVRPSGQVTFFDGSAALGTASLVLSKGSMRATFSTSALTTGFHVLTARYLGSGAFAGSTSSPLAETIYTGTKPASTATSLVSSVNPSPVNQGFALTAIVKASGKTPPTGSVQFFVDGVLAGSSALVQGNKGSSTATIGASISSVGTHSVVALYVGSSSMASSTSTPLSEVIQ